MVGVVTKAPDGATLNSSYATRCVTYEQVKCLLLEQQEVNSHDLVEIQSSLY